jgi:hypothetical protein
VGAKMKHNIGVSERRRGRQRGSNIMEFALLSIFLFPLFMGTITTGMGLGKMIQTAQISRDAGHMFVRLVDFSLPANQDLIVRLANGMNMTRTGGNGTVVLTQVLMIGDDECNAAGLSGTNCANRYYPVITQRLVIGNPSLYSSSIGSPSANLIHADGTIDVNDYLTDVSCRALTLSTNTSPNPYVGLLTLNASERTYISEAYFTAPELAFLNNNQPVNIYARNYF